MEKLGTKTILTRYISDSKARKTKKITIEKKPTTNEINKSIETLLSNEKK